MASNFVKISPKIKPSLQSGSFFPNNNASKASNINNQVLVGNFDTTVNSGNITYPFNNDVQIFNTQTDFVGFSSNSMFDSGNYNVIKTQILNNSPDTINLHVRYCNDNDVTKSQLKYTTTIDPEELFYRNIPVRNQYFQIAVEGVSDSGEATGNIQGELTLSRYTQMNIPTQIDEKVTSNDMAMNDRSINSFNDDVVLGRRSDVHKATRLGISDSITALEKTVWNANGLFNFTSNTATDLVLRSTSALDTGIDIVITGVDFADKIATDRITLAGTSNAFAITSFKVITDMRMVDETNVGVIKCASLTNNTFNYMDAGAGRSTSLIYMSPDKRSAVVQSLNISGRTTLNTDTHLELYKIENLNKKTLLYKDNRTDCELNNTVELNEPLTGTDIIYGVLKSSNVGIVGFGDSPYSCLLNVFEYDDN